MNVAKWRAGHRFTPGQTGVWATVPAGVVWEVHFLAVNNPSTGGTTASISVKLAGGAPQLNLLSVNALPNRASGFSQVRFVLRPADVLWLEQVAGFFADCYASGLVRAFP